MPNRARSFTNCAMAELAHFKLIPHTPYYGTADATPLYLITLHAAWRATGDGELLERQCDQRGNFAPNGLVQSSSAVHWD
jgi:glycogen debranching enzyme